jgi:hypothetical protein
MRLDLTAIPPGAQFLCPGCSTTFVRPPDAAPAPPPPSVIAVPPLGAGSPPAYPLGTPPGPPPKAAGMAIAAMILSIVGTFICPIVSIVGIILGFVANGRIKADPRRLGGGGMALAGIIVGFAGMGFWLLFSLIMVPLIAIPNFVNLRAKAYNSSAQSTSYNAKIAEEVYRQNNRGDHDAYTNRLSDLLKWDKNLTDDPAVTFTFGACNNSGYTFTTTHAKGDMSYLTTD